MLLSRGDAIRNIRVSNIHGAFRYYAVSFTHHYPLREDMPVLLENIHLSDIYASKSKGAPSYPHLKPLEHGGIIWFEHGIHCRNVLVENVYRRERNTETEVPTIRIDETVKHEDLCFRNIYTQSEQPLTQILNLSGKDITLL